MKKLPFTLFVLVMCLTPGLSLADPANIAGDTYGFSNYIDVSIPGGLDATLAFTDEFMLRVGPGELDTSLKGVDYDLSFNVPLLGLIVMNSENPGPLPPSYFSIEYDADSLPTSFTFAAPGAWSLDVDLALNSASLSSPAGFFEEVLLVPELLVDGIPSPAQRPPVVAPIVSVMQHVVTNYYLEVSVEELSHNLRTVNHIRHIEQLIANLKEARTALVQQMVNQVTAEP